MELEEGTGLWIKFRIRKKGYGGLRKVRDYFLKLIITVF